MAESKHRNASSPEMKHAQKCRVIDRNLKSKCDKEEQKIVRYQRQLDRQMLVARQELVDINARTPSPCRHSPTGSAVPDIAVSSADDSRFHSARSGHSQVSKDEECVGVDLLGAKTKHNLALSEKLSRSIEAIHHKRETSPRSPSSPGAHKGLSPRAFDDLQKAAQVLKHTKHEPMVQKLLASVTSTSPRS